MNLLFWTFSLLNSLAIVFSSYSIGKYLSNKIRLQCQFISIKLAIGIAVIVFITGWLSYFQIFYTKYILFVLYIISIRELFRIKWDNIFQYEMDRYGKFYILLLGIFLLVSFPSTMNFPIYGDSLEVHYPIIDDIITNHGITIFERLIFYGFGFGSWNLYALDSNLPVMYFPAIIHFVFFILTLLIIIEFALLFTKNLTVAILSGLIASTIFVCTWLSTAPYYDFPAQYFMLLLIMYITKLIYQRENMNFGRITILSFLFFGSFVMKQYGVFILLISIPLILIYYKRINLKWIHILAGIFITGILLLPYIIPVWQKFGSPFFPRVCSHPFYCNEANITSYTDPINLKTVVDKILFYFVRATFDFPLDTKGYSFFIGPLFISVLPLSLIQMWKSNNEPFKILFLTSLVYIIGWVIYTDGSILRYYLFPYFVLSIIVGDFIQNLLVNKNKKKLTKYALVLLIILHIVPSVLYNFRKLIIFNNKPLASKTSFYLNNTNNFAHQENIAKDLLPYLEKDTKIFAYGGIWYHLKYFSSVETFLEKFPHLESNYTIKPSFSIADYDILILPKEEYIFKSQLSPNSFLNEGEKMKIKNLISTIEDIIQNDSELIQFNDYTYFNIYVKNKIIHTKAVF